MRCEIEQNTPKETEFKQMAGFEEEDLFLICFIP